MKNNILIRVLFLSIFIFAANSFAQTEESSDQKDSVNMHAGDWAMMIRLTENFNFTSFNGTNFSGKYHFTPSDALIFGISFIGTSSDLDLSNQYQYNDTTSSGGSQNSSQGGINISLSIVYGRYFNIAEPVSFYLGAGPVISYNHSKNELEGQNLNNYQISSMSEGFEESTSYTYGLLLAAGVEWFISERTSIIAEYGTSFNYQTISYNSDYTETNFTGDNSVFKNINERSETNYYIDANHVKVGIVFYFN